jgi:site-specific recombinase XerD
VGHTALEDFAHHLTRAKRSPLTIKNYRCDLTAFASWFRDTTGDGLTPAHIAPTDPRDYKRSLADRRGRLPPSGVQRLLRAYAYAAHLEALRPHRLRHTSCKNLIDAGVGLEQVATLAGHESLKTTRRYCTPSFKDLEHAVERIGEEA